MAIETAAGIAAIGAGLAIGLGAIGTGLAQQGIGASVIGAIAEDDKMFGKGLFFLLLPETLVIFGLVIAIIILLGAGLI
ncbi:TPA: ATPase [Candidatus Woesearchaeota archaeon]|nr:ATPase [Candidatus Woesearchaeota archaeon]HIH05097.1 ATPase [Candidatus Woesearchaeota archaeon]HIH91280.1 ATPase [Candidatus Woesearchaeota archaeon]HII64087.1 ATPase [Candidatus Woesearchaeota archaeon]HII66344.1 ATPase [Candidatus Woesearchaeota archaeon]